MKKILILFLVISVLLFGACTKNYDKIFDDMQNLELKDIFESEEEKIEFLKQVQENYDNKKYLTYERENYTYDYVYGEYSEETTYIENKVILKYQKEENKLSVSVKRIVEKGIEVIETEKDNYVLYYEKNKTYMNDIEKKLKITYGGNSNNFDSIIAINTHRQIGNDFFVGLYLFGLIDKIGKDKNGNIVIISNNNLENGNRACEKYIFKNGEFIAYEFISFEHEQLESYIIETYDYKKNTLKYPDFSNYEYAGDFYD